MSTPAFDAILDQQKQNWNQFSQGWKKWDEFNMKFLSPMGERIIAALEVQPQDIILDIATGTGEPGLTLAGMVPKGRVVGQDLSDGMLETAAEHAAEKGLTNYEVLSCDVSALPFDDNTFDAISCRMGFMFFPDMQKAATEMARVLKPGGRIATSVWGAPQKNFWIGGLMGIISKSLDMPPPPPGSPGMFRCAQNGMIADLFKHAGLKNISESEIESEVDYGSIDNYWTMMTEVAAPVVAAMNKADQATRVQIENNLRALMQTRLTGDRLKLPFASLVISARK